MSSGKERDTGIEIRLATAEDAPPISVVLFRSFIEYQSNYTPEGFAATTPNAEQIQVRMTEGPVWVALFDGEIVGTVSAVLQGESLYLRGMAVLPSARGHQIGELLIDNIQSFASTNKCKRLFLSTTPFLNRAIALYERLGFIRTGAGPHDLGGTPLRTMEKAIEPTS